MSMNKIWEHIKTSSHHERNYIIAIVRTMAKGYTNMEATMSDKVADDLRGLGLTVERVKGTSHNVIWGDVGEECHDKDHCVPKASGRNASDWDKYIKSMGVSGENKHGIGRVE